MNEPSKHALFIGGLIGSITLEQVNTIVSICCGIIVAAGAGYSLWSNWKKDHKGKRK
jgi:hypothetical protein